MSIQHFADIDQQGVFLMRKLPRKTRALALLWTSVQNIAQDFFNSLRYFKLKTNLIGIVNPSTHEYDPIIEMKIKFISNFSE